MDRRPDATLSHGSQGRKQTPLMDRVANGNTSVRMLGPEIDEQQYLVPPHALNIAHYILIALTTTDTPL